ncbi:hypothetical protein CFN78_06960 [Amycolatopsis antarctica]|uniref:Recombinase RecT n=1 Tax=Amycolatopsis antarctica TaxID=1854586 RepID=A0A263D6M7_9PSEU|nr:hypothetical protein [Amycolatopsis antarctica]OZM74021.1 hypothetical protein CFN78_06960 [Amycolatopsis antarctica]
MPSNEIAVAEQQPAKRPVALTGRQGDLDTAYRLSQNLSVSNLIPNDLKGKPSDVLVILLYGQELGLAPMQAIQTIDVMKGRPSLRANLWVALARRAGHKVRVTENTATSCTVTVIRSDDPDGPISVTYTIDDAKTAGLTSNANYQKNPKAMLYARAASTAIRQACPEVAMGFSDEYELAEPEPTRPTLAQVAAERVPAAAEPAPVQEPIEQPDVPDADLLADLAEIERENAAPADEPVDALWSEGGDQ